MLCGNAFRRLAQTAFVTSSIELQQLPTPTCWSSMLQVRGRSTFSRSYKAYDGEGCLAYVRPFYLGRSWSNRHGVNQHFWCTAVQGEGGGTKSSTHCTTLNDPMFSHTAYIYSRSSVAEANARTLAQSCDTHQLQKRKTNFTPQ